MVDIEFTSTGFRELEALPQQVGFGIVSLTQHLRTNPEMGKVVIIPRAPVGQYRMLIYRGTHRIIYEFDVVDNRVYVGAVQDCRQKLPDARTLKRDQPFDEDLSLS